MNIQTIKSGRQFRRTAALAVGLCLWLASVAYGMITLWEYDSNVGETGSPVVVWPENFEQIQFADSYSLVMFAHPRCPCTRSSLNELVRMAEQTDSKATVVFWQPALMEQSESNWRNSELISTAETHPRLTVLFDVGGAAARAFGAMTSGHCMIYDRHRVLRFTGGITLGRGHQGENSGNAAAKRLLTNLTSENAKVRSRLSGTELESFPVFGCPLNPPTHQN